MTNVAQQKPVSGSLAGAVKQNDSEGVEELLRRGADCNDKDNSGWNALLLAADRGYTDIVRLLIAKGADVNGTEKSGFTPLMAAVSGRYTEIAQLLIDNGAEVDARNSSGVTVLMYALSAYAKESVRLLLDNGAYFTASDFNGDEPEVVAERYNYPELVQLLKDAPELQRRHTEEVQARSAAGQAHARAVEKQKILKARVPKVILIGGFKP